MAIMPWVIIMFWNSIIYLNNRWVHSKNPKVFSSLADMRRFFEQKITPMVHTTSNFK